MRIPNICCIYYNSYGKCNHPDRKKAGLFWNRKSLCNKVIYKTCKDKIPHNKPIPSPPSPQIRQINGNTATNIKRSKPSKLLMSSREAEQYLIEDSNSIEKDNLKLMDISFNTICAKCVKEHLSYNLKTKKFRKE